MRRSSSNLIWLLIVIVVAAAGGYYAYKYYQLQDDLDQAKTQVEKLSKDPSQAAKEQNRLLVAEIGKLTVLPANETPTVATVTDVSKLQNQVFFANAQNGDKVLIYTQAKKAVLYRPSTNKVINIAPVNIGSSNSSTNSSSGQ